MPHARLYERAVRISPDAVTVSRLEDGIIVDANTSFYALTGHRPEGALGRTSIELGLYPEARGRTEILRRVLHWGSVGTHQITMRTVEGNLRRASVSAHIVPAGGTVYLASSARDVTRRAAARDELHREVQRLQHTCCSDRG